MNRPTIDDVASRAGVARTTVSRVLNDQPNVRAVVREKVMRAVDELGYRVNQQARNLAGRKTVRIVLVHASDFDSEPNSYFASALELGATRMAAQRGAQLITHVVNQNDPGAAADIVERVCDDLGDGVILTPPFADDLALLAALRDRGVAVICVAGGPEAERLVMTVGIDEHRAGHDIARHLLSLGHRSFGYIKGIKGHLSAEGRYEGFLKALEEAGMGEGQVRATRGNFTFRSGLDCAQELLSRGGAVTALVCANDDMAAGALLAAHKAGLAIPQDIAITGFDDTPVSEIVWPPLTTIHQPLRRMGARAVELLVARAADSAEAQTGRELVQHDLVVRESTTV
ncbi:MAG: LacI family DNA-binding transcriptional regulator [Sphingomonadales bacterium]|nr:LacI family DNA-binding transcriptional regulator [Sphingomonadales bacterium]